MVHRLRPANDFRGWHAALGEAVQESSDCRSMCVTYDRWLPACFGLQRQLVTLRNLSEDLIKLRRSDLVRIGGQASQAREMPDRQVVSLGTRSRRRVEPNERL